MADEKNVDEIARNLLEGRIARLRELGCTGTIQLHVDACEWTDGRKWGFEWHGSIEEGGHCRMISRVDTWQAFENKAVEHLAQRRSNELWDRVAAGA